MLVITYIQSNKWRAAFLAGLTSEYSTRGVAVADYDRDGWSEAALWAWNGANPGIQLYQNESAAQNPDFHFLTLQLQGNPDLPGPLKSTRDAIGARAYVTADFDGNGTVEDDETRMEEVLSGSRDTSNRRSTRGHVHDGASLRHARVSELADHPQLGIATMQLTDEP